MKNKKNEKKNNSQIKQDTKLNDFVNKVKKGDYSKEPVNGSLRINTCYTVNNLNSSYTFGIR